MKTLATASFVVLGLAGLAACGGESRSDTTTPADADVTVRALDGIAWDSKSYTATSTDGEVVVFGLNDSSIAHNLHVQDTDGNNIGDGIDLPRRGSNGEVTLSLTPGEYRIVCLVPGHNNMSSTLTVD